MTQYEMGIPHVSLRTMSLSLCSGDSLPRV
jgi:hypothetical protein